MQRAAHWEHPQNQRAPGRSRPSAIEESMQLLSTSLPIWDWLAAMFEAAPTPDVCQLPPTCLSQSKHPESQQELNSCRSPESPRRPPCLRRPFAASSNTLVHSMYPWERRGEITLHVYEQEKVEGGSDSDRQCRESVGAPEEMPGWWMREKLLCSPEFGKEEFEEEKKER